MCSVDDGAYRRDFKDTKGARVYGQGIYYIRAFWEIVLLQYPKLGWSTEIVSTNSEILDRVLLPYLTDPSISGRSLEDHTNGTGKPKE